MRKLAIMAKEYKMSTLRSTLFEAIDDVRAKRITFQEAKAVCDLAQIIINSVKVEVDYMKAIGAKPTGGFIELENPT